MPLNKLPKALLFVEPGPVTLISTFDGHKNNVMTISWTMPIDFDGSIIGFVDDFLVFMAAFCFTFAQFSRKVNPINRRQLYIFSVTFMILAILWILLLVYSPVLQLVA